MVSGSTDKKTETVFKTLIGLAHPLLPGTRIHLSIGHPDIERKHAQVERIFASTVTDPEAPGRYEFQVSRDFERLKPQFQWGIGSHEIGHLFAIHLHNRHDESDADLSMLYTFGIPLEHGSRLNIQWVPEGLIDELKRVCRSGGSLIDIRWSHRTRERERRTMLKMGPYRRD